MLTFELPAHLPFISKKDLLSVGHKPQAHSGEEMATILDFVIGYYPMSSALFFTAEISVESQKKNLFHSGIKSLYFIYYGTMILLFLLHTLSRLLRHSTICQCFLINILDLLAPILYIGAITDISSTEYVKSGFHSTLFLHSCFCTLIQC